jgi:hypothetical protein
VAAELVLPPGLSPGGSESGFVRQGDGIVAMPSPRKNLIDG